MRRLLLPLLCFFASCGPAATNAICPNFAATGECDGQTARYCDATTDGQSPASFNCAALNASCAMDPTYGAWCAAPAGASCTAAGQGRSGYLFCGDASGPSAALACDLEKGCVTGPGACTPGMMTAPTCSGDVLVVDCTPWGQPVIHDCKGLGGTGCAMGACVGVPPGGTCSGAAQCAPGYACDATSKTCVFTPAMHPPMAQVLSLGGPVLTHPKVLAISWATDTAQGMALDKVVAELITDTSGYWAATTSEYGVGALVSAGPVVHLNETVPTSFTDAAFMSLISQNTTGSSPAWGPIDTQTIYVIAIPSGVSFDDGTGSKCCSDWDGYHSEGYQAGTRFPYAVVCSCPGFDGPQETNAQQLTVVTSHELVEAATDPYASSRPAFAQTDDDHAVWTVTSSGELADMCEFLDDAAYLPPGATQTVQRTWSNRAAAAGENPCVPAPTPFAGTEPVLTTAGKLLYNGPWNTKVVKIAVGQTGVVDLPLFSSAPVGTWQVRALDYNADWIGGARKLMLHLDKNSGQNGDVLHLSITPTSFDSSIGGAVFFVESVLDGGTTLTMGAVVAP